MTHLSHCCQRAWLLKLLAIELHAGDMSSSSHREACQSILAHLFGGEIVGIGADNAMSHSLSLVTSADAAGMRTISKSKVMDGFSVTNAHQLEKNVGTCITRVSMKNRIKLGIKVNKPLSCFYI